MYGQTCCYLLPEGEYAAVEMKNDEVFICSERSARNMAYQHLTRENENVEVICKIKGADMMGLPLRAPLAVR
jgi:leucyl-tRNA synthetase